MIRVGLMKRPTTDQIGALAQPWEAGNVERGARYRVLRLFQDADGDRHPVGEEWVLVSTGFNKFDNELELRVRDGSGGEWIIPLGWDQDRQQEVLERWSNYVGSV